MSAFFCIVNAPFAGVRESERASIHRDRLSFALLVCAAAAAILALLAIRTEAKLPVAGSIAEMLPNLFGTILGLPAGADPNELAGVLVLFAPVALAWCIGALHSPREQREGERSPVTGYVLILVFYTAILLTQSRDGLMSAGVATVLTFALLGRRGLLPAGVTLVLLFAAVFAIGSGRMVDSLLFAGKHTGLTFDSVLSFRFVIWDRGLLALRDVLPAGLGFGAFGRVLPELYPVTLSHGAVVLADAHNLYLQSALDFGFAGAVVFLVLIAAALRMSWRAVRLRGPLEYWSIGMFAGLTGFLLFNLFDAVSLGSRAGVGLWMFLGILCRIAPQQTRDERAAQSRRRRIAATVAIVAALGGVLFLAPVRSALRTQHATVVAARAFMVSPEELREARSLTARAARQTPSVGWLQGLVCERLDDVRGRDSAWTALVGWSARYIPLLRLRAPYSRVLAERAVAAQATSAEAHFWLAGILAATDTARAIALYRAGLKYDTDDGLSWYRLGSLLASSDPKQAIAAFGESCVHGDPGANGCLQAGRTAEQIGDIPLAIRWYDKSRYFVARDRAEQLRRGLR
ncbi:MAG: O-antigen ligase family protein [Ignavibacteria bacterium]|nr:O-antigen ligase family protein [Ignavibacteria bacterium]